MMQFEKYTEYAVEQAKKLLAIDSPSGYGYYVTEYLLKEFAALGIPARRTIKGGVIADFGGKEDENGILLEAHCDTLGGMVSQIKENGRLKLTNIGGLTMQRLKTCASLQREGTSMRASASLSMRLFM